MRMLGAEPACPLLLVTVNPATLPFSALSKLVVGRSFRASLFTSEAEPA